DIDRVVHGLPDAPVLEGGTIVAHPDEDVTAALHGLDRRDAGTVDAVDLVGWDILQDVGAPGEQFGDAGAGLRDGAEDDGLNLGFGAPVPGVRRHRQVIVSYPLLEDIRTGANGLQGRLLRRQR